MYADGLQTNNRMHHLLSVQHTKIHARAHTQATCPPDVVNAQTAAEWYFWVSFRARGITPKEALRRFLFLLKTYDWIFLTLCCSLLPAQKTAAEQTLPSYLSCVFTTGQTDRLPHEDIHTLALQPLVQKHPPCTELGMRKSRQSSEKSQ